MSVSLEVLSFEVEDDLEVMNDWFKVMKVQEMIFLGAEIGSEVEDESEAFRWKQFKEFDEMIESYYTGLCMVATCCQFDDIVRSVGCIMVVLVSWCRCFAGLMDDGKALIMFAYSMILLLEEASFIILFHPEKLADTTGNIFDSCFDVCEFEGVKLISGEILTFDNVDPWYKKLRDEVIEYVLQDLKCNVLLEDGSHTRSPS
ncbi:hypothetical protein KIW84_041956 [Lathyrus oleraceus]|uniref:Uncharacterized protein n=1 Tax=Pisum sativum TaxID=3888 RepID=A0A9D5ARY0_PEA|nr:hypothetical protein KIW84_041956 [Pisum sativum]